VRRIIGTCGINKGLDQLLTDPVEPVRMHEIQRRLQIVHCAGANTGDPRLELSLHREDEQEADACLTSLKLPPDTLLVSIHPGAKDLFKQWPPSHFVQLGKKLTSSLKCTLFVTGTPSEKSLVRQIAEQIPGAIPITHLKLRPFAAFLKRMHLTIVNDTGPMHVAFAMNTPTLALFTPTDPELCGPYFAQNVQVISKHKTCTPCLRKRCREPFCLLQIGVEEALSAALQLVNQRD
jgi:ADP-heptose:LPS heptosyltransferase